MGSAATGLVHNPEPKVHRMQCFCSSGFFPGFLGRAPAGGRGRAGEI